MLLAGCRRALEQAGLTEDQVDVFSVPGAWELPLAARQLAAAERYDGIIALGAVVRGETAHFEFISGECARGLQRVSLDSGLPVGFGVLTPEHGEQAVVGGGRGRGAEGPQEGGAVLGMVTGTVQSDR